MTSLLFHFLNMGGYGFFVWSAYGCVMIFLLVQWFLPYRRWQKYQRNKIAHE